MCTGRVHHADVQMSIVAQPWEHGCRSEDWNIDYVKWRESLNLLVEQLDSSRTLHWRLMGVDGMLAVECFGCGQWGHRVRNCPNLWRRSD